MRLEVVRSSLDEFFPGVFVIGIGNDLKPPRGEAGLLDWRLSGAISRLVIQGFVEGSAGENMLMWSRRRRSKVYIFGTGASARPTGKAIAACAESIAETLAGARENEVVLLARHLLGTEEDVERGLAFLSGFLAPLKNDPNCMDDMRVLLAANSHAEKYHESLRKAILRKGKDAEAVELVFTEGA